MKTIVKISHQKFLILSVLFIWIHLHLGCSSDESQGTEPVNAFGEVYGTILSEDGTAYSNILIELKTSGGTVEASDVTDASGKYEIVQVPVGNYTLDVKSPLASTVNSNGRTISVMDGQSVTQDFSFNIMWVDANVVLEPNDPLNEVRNVVGQIPDNSDPIYTPESVGNPSGPLVPIMAPDGHHITLQEWTTAQGNALVTCDGNSTHFKLEFTGLIPDGKYTLWNAIFKKHQEPSDALNFMADLIGLGALADENDNIIIASATGEASFEISLERSSLSMFGSRPDCAITEVPGFAIVVDYHIDGNTYGSTPGPDDKEVGHLLFYF
jgi:hypothetical protein